MIPAAHDKTHGLSRINQLKLVSHYAGNFLSNPRYINDSIPDTLFGFLSYYLQAKDYYSIFDFLTGDQAEIERVIIGGYDWETSPDTKSTWRIGDGTASFYNYTYLVMAGFTEYDTFRSNQIREGGWIEKQPCNRSMRKMRHMQNRLNGIVTPSTWMQSLHSKR